MHSCLELTAMLWLRYVSLKISVNLNLICFQKAALNFGDLLQEPLQRYAYTTICDEDTVFFNPKFKAKPNFINLGKKEAKPVKLDGVAPYHSCALYIDRINAELFFSWWSCPQRQGETCDWNNCSHGKIAKSCMVEQKINYNENFWDE